MKEDDKLFLLKEIEKVQGTVLRLVRTIETQQKQIKALTDTNAAMVEFMLQQEVKIRELEEKVNEQE
jgi:hypothetical protein